MKINESFNMVFTSLRYQHACPCCGNIYEGNKPVHVSLETNCISHGMEIARLTSRQTEILYLMAKHMPSPVRLELLMRELWPIGVDEPKFALNILHVCITEIRKKIKLIGLKINSVRGVGYKLVEARLLMRSSIQTKNLKSIGQDLYSGVKVSYTLSMRTDGAPADTSHLANGGNGNGASYTEI